MNRSSKHVLLHCVFLDHVSWRRDIAHYRRDVGAGSVVGGDQKPCSFKDT